MGREEALATRLWAKVWWDQTAGGRVAHSLTPLVHVHYNNNLDEGRLMSHIDFRTSFNVIVFWICRYLILNFPETMDAQDVQVLLTI